MSVTSTIFDMNHPGISLVHEMRRTGMHEDTIRVRLLSEEIELQQRVNRDIIGKHIPRIPTQEEINRLRVLEVACVYSSINDLSSAGNMQKIAKVQLGMNPYFNGQTMSAQWQNTRDNHIAHSKPTIKKHGTVLTFKR